MEDGGRPCCGHALVSPCSIIFIYSEIVIIVVFMLNFVLYSVYS